MEHAEKWLSVLPSSDPDQRRCKNIFTETIPVSHLPLLEFADKYNILIYPADAAALN